MDGWAQDCGISIDNILEILQFWTEPFTYMYPTGAPHLIPGAYRCTHSYELIEIIQLPFIDGLQQDCSISIANTMKIPQPCDEPSNNRSQATDPVSGAHLSCLVVHIHSSFVAGQQEPATQPGVSSMGLLPDT